jgi:aspartyl-tRNA(Asn)/glutamyl-tRNA(Gln) amidotransferase subunit A
LGTDTGGSIRIPASLCGVVGLKPTYGRVSLRGVIPLSWNLDHTGPLARCVLDTAILLQAIAGYDPLDPYSANVPVDDYLERIEGGVKGWRIVLASDEFFTQVTDGEVLEAVHSAARVFKNLGTFVEAVPFPDVRQAAQANGLMTPSDGAAYHRERLATHPEMFGADIRQRLETGAALTSTEYILARRTQTVLRHQFARFFEEHDLLLTPTTPVVAPPIEGPDAIEQARLLTRFTSPFNLTGLPALSVPCGFNSQGLPVGLQLVTAPWAEAKLLRAAYAYEQAAIWQPRTPVI